MRVNKAKKKKENVSHVTEMIMMIPNGRKIANDAQLSIRDRYNYEIGRRRSSCVLFGSVASSDALEDAAMVGKCLETLYRFEYCIMIFFIPKH